MKSIVFIFTLVLTAMMNSNGQNLPQANWSTAFLRDATLWTTHMNDAIVKGDQKYLHVEVAPNRTWAIAGIAGIKLPATVSGVRVRIHSVQRGAKWLVRLHGDLRGTDYVTDFGPFNLETGTGVRVIMIDPRILKVKAGRPIMVQLGLEGPAGSSVEFESLEFISGGVSGKSRIRYRGQKSIEAVDYMPYIPQPFHIIDWKLRAIQYDRFVFNFNLKGQYFPLIWLDNTRVNIPGPAFGLCSYVGDGRQGEPGQEGINCIAAVLGASLVGIDKSKQENKYVAMCNAFYHSQDGSNLVLNNTRGDAGGSFWYDIMTNIIFDALADRYPSEKVLAEPVRASADRWIEALQAMGGGENAVPNLDHTAFNFRTMKPVDNGSWKEPDAAGGIAWMEYAAWIRFKEPKYLQAADHALRFLDLHKRNPYYEAMLPWGTLIAARMNGELGRKYNVDKLLNWCFGLSDCRGGWGVTVQKWGDYDCAGLVGSVDNRGGYAFAMNTFSQAAALTPLVRYDSRYACAIGKWMLNLTNAARLFYPDGLPSAHQSPPIWNEDKQNVIAYEGLRAEWLGKSPCATGDPVFSKWGPKTDRGLYGSSYVGFLGTIVKRTSDEKILALDCLATDFYHRPAYPTLLCYNPYTISKKIRLPFVSGRNDLYDLVTHKYLTRDVKGQAPITIPARGAVLVVYTPAKGKTIRQGKKLLVNGVTFDYAVEKP